MSLVDEARAVRERIAARLRELEPLVAEYNELQKVAAEMGVQAHEPISAAAVTSEEPRQRPTPGTERPRRTTSAAKAVPPVASGNANNELAQRVLEVVRKQPGKTVAEYAELLALSPAALYRPVRELTTAGAVVKRGRQLFPA